MNQESIEVWYEQFASDLGRMQDSCLAYHYEKILLVSFLDALAKTVAVTAVGRNQERFLRLLTEFTPWREGNGISIPDLKRLLDVVQDSRFDEARLLVDSTLETWQPEDVENNENEWPGSHIGLDRGPSIEELYSVWPLSPRGEEGKISVSTSGSRTVNLTLESLQHKQLFWAYRNVLVHEANVCGRSIERPEHQEPYYSWDLDLAQAGRVRRWRLHFPLGFFRSLCKDALSSVKRHLLQEDLDPLQMWDRWHWWLPSLGEA